MGPIKAPSGCALNKQKRLIDPGVEVEMMWAWDEILNKHKNTHGSRLKAGSGKQEKKMLVVIELVPVVLMANLNARITAKHKN